MQDGHGFSFITGLFFGLEYTFHLVIKGGYGFIDGGIEL